MTMGSVNMNNIIIKGRLVRDPELKFVDTKNGSQAVCTFDVAVDKQFGEGADFFRCQMWGKRGEAIDKYFTKGQEILIQGQHESRPYTDKEGNKRVAWELKASQFEFCGSKKDNQNSAQSAGLPEEFTPVEDDDLPF